MKREMIMKSILSVFAVMALGVMLSFAGDTKDSSCCPKGDCCKKGAVCKKAADGKKAACCNEDAACCKNGACCKKTQTS